VTGLWQAVCAGLLASTLLFASLAEGRRDRERREPGPVVALSELPAQARETLAAIRRGGPFRFDRDGVVFGNRERLLPAKPRGYYHEYTVPTPGSRTRGARRIVCGGDIPSLTECYYSDDHYQSFKRIGR
jgi:ribonuclease T1